MQKLIILTLLTIFQVTVQHVQTNYNWQNDIENVANEFMSSQGGRSIVEMLLNATTNDGSTQILQNVISVLSDSNGGTGSIYGSLMKTLFTMFTNDVLGNIKDSPILSGIISKLKQDVSLSNVLTFFSIVANAIDSFVKMEGISNDHSGHNWFVPPIIEKMHVLYDMLVNSPLVKKFVLTVTDSKFYKTFVDESGSFSFGKLGDLLENHSFRKRWIHSVAFMVSQIIVRIFDPNLRISMLTIVQGQINNALKMEGFPKSTFLNINEPVESVSALINYFSKRFVGYTIQSKTYVKVAFDGFKNFYDTVLFGRYFDQLNTEDLSNTLTNILNMEIIEPVVKTYRGFRFAKKHKECDRYVMCLINNYDTTISTNLPFIKEGLTKVTSLVSSWFLSGYNGTSFYKLIIAIVPQDSCKDLFYKTCEGFHAEEIRVTRDYSHSEL